MPLSVLNVEILDLDVHGPLALALIWHGTLVLALIGHGPLVLAQIGTEEFVHRSLSWWLTKSHALAGIVVGE